MICARSARHRRRDGIPQKVKEQANAAAAATKEAAAKGKSQLDDLQAKKAADAMLRDLGALSYGSVTSRESATSEADATRLVEALQARDRARQLSLALESPVGKQGRADAPPVVAERASRRARGATSEELAEWLPVSEASYAADREAAGEPRAIAERVAHESRSRTFPDGVPAAGHHVFGVVADGVRVGIVWLGPSLNGDETERYLQDRDRRAAPPPGARPRGDARGRGLDAGRRRHPARPQRLRLQRRRALALRQPRLRGRRDEHASSL